MILQRPYSLFLQTFHTIFKESWVEPFFCIFTLIKSFMKRFCYHKEDFWKSWEKWQKNHIYSMEIIVSEKHMPLTVFEERKEIIPTSFRSDILAIKKCNLEDGHWPYNYIYYLVSASLYLTMKIVAKIAEKISPKNALKLQ